MAITQSGSPAIGNNNPIIPSLWSADTDLFQRSIAEQLGINYDDNRRLFAGIAMFKQFCGEQKLKIKTTTHKWFEQMRLAPPPILISAAERCLIDGTPSGSGTYILATYASSSVETISGNYTSYGKVYNRVGIKNNMLDLGMQNFTIVKKTAPVGSNTTHTAVLQFDNGVTNYAAIATILNTGTNSLMIISSIANDLTEPTQVDTIQYTKYDAVLQNYAYKVEYAKQAIVEELMVNIPDGMGGVNKYLTNAMEYQRGFQMLQDTNKQLLFGKRGIQASPNIQGLTTTDGLVDVAKASNYFEVPISLIESGFAADFYQWMNLNLSFVNANSSNIDQIYLNGQRVSTAIDQGFATHYNNSAMFVRMDDLATINYGGNTMKLQDFSNKTAIKYGGFKFFFMAMESFDDDYLGDEFKSISLQIPAGTVPTYNEQMADTIVKLPSVTEMCQVDKDGRSLAYQKNGPIAFNEQNPRIDGLDVITTHYRYQTGFGFHGREQMSLTRYV